MSSLDSAFRKYRKALVTIMWAIIIRKGKPLYVGAIHISKTPSFNYSLGNETSIIVV